jgi:putative hydroxymethylpyrimidine transport system substrate-binding protein
MPPAPLLIACGEAEVMEQHDPVRIRVLLDWKRDAKHAVLAEAERLGAFARRGLRIDLVDPLAKSADSLEAVSRGLSEVAINYPHNMMCLRDACPGIVSFGALVKRNPEGLLSLRESGISGPSRLAGRRVGIGPSPVSRAQFELFLRANGLAREDVEVVTVGFEGEDLLLSGKIDALDAVAYAIPRTRRKGHETDFLFYADSGLPDSPFLVFVARSDWLGANLAHARAFLQETAAVFPAVEAWGTAEWKRYVQDLPERNAEEEKEVWDATLPLMRGTGPLFRQDREALRGLARILLERGIISSPFSVDEAFRDIL